MDLDLFNQIINNYDIDSLKLGYSLDWCYKGDIKCFLNTVDIFQLRKYGVKVDIIPYTNYNNLR